MEKATQFLLLVSSIILLLLPLPVQPTDPCEQESCHPTRGPVVRFPFRLRSLQPSRCGYPGFNLRCNSRNQTILSLPRSGDFVVHHIDYKASAVYIGDLGFCLPARALNFSLSGSVFDGATYLTRFGILNCTDGLSDDMHIESYNFLLPCLSTRNSTVMAVDVDLPADMVPPLCRRMNNVSVPPLTYSEFSWGPMGTGEDFELRWGRPGCGRCESRGGRCGFKEDSGFEVKCYGSSGFPRGAKYAIIIGGGIPGLLCVLGLIGYAYKKMENDMQQRRVSNDLPTSFFNGQLVGRATAGLDITTIESYPETELGQSRRLPNPSDNTCSICLCDYQPKETLKTIPECNHYFHATCIDEWLKLNGTCPLCRNSPQTSSATSTSASSSSPSSTASHRN